MNNGRSVSDPNENLEAKSPSLDYYSTQLYPTEIYVIYQQKTPNGKYKIKLAKYNENGQEVFNLDVFSSTKDYATFDATPVVAVTRTYGLANNKPKITMVWRQQAEGSYQNGLYYYGAIDNGNDVTLYYLSPQKFTSTDSQSSNPTIAVYKNPYSVILNHVAWQQGDTKIKYRGIYDNWNGGDVGGLSESGNLEEPSYGIGITKNSNPSITVLNYGTYPEYIYNYDSPKLTWVASFYPQDFFAVFRDKNNSQYGTPWNNFHLYYNGSEEIKKVNINRTDQENYFAFVYNEGSNNKYVKSTNLSTVQLLNTHVTDLQISNIMQGWEGMDIIAYNNSSLPYSFTNAETIFFYKEVQISEGRGISVSRGNAEFYFSFGDISLDDTQIDFKEKSDTLNTKKNENLNNYLETKPFLVNDNSILTYNISYGVKDSTMAINELKNNESINYKIEIVDNKEGKVLSILNEIIQIKNELKNQRNIYYKVNCSGLGNREIKLRLIEEDNINGDYTFTKIHLSNNSLKKKDYNEINLDGEFLVKEYLLEQNYPNPFNPTTTINYQIPIAGFVSLKVYDILGREVAVLVNGEKEVGKYTVQFDGSKLASGVYIYELRANEFVSVKKLMLLK